MKRIFLIGLTICLCFALFACSENDDEGVMTFKDASASESLYSYWMSTYKSNFLYYYNEGIDSDEFWDTLISDEQTYEEYIVQWINDEMKHRVVALWMFDDYGLEVPQSKLDQIEADISEKIEYAGTREELNKSLAKMNMNIDMLRQVYIDNAKYDILYDHLYGSSGINAPNNEDRAEYFKNNYYCLKYITIYSGANLKTDAQGNYVYDDDGKIELVRLTEEEKAVKQQLIDTVVAGLEAGGDFDEYSKEFSEVDYSDYPNGFFVSENDYSRFGSDIIKAAVELGEDELRVVSDDNVTYIIKKIKMPQYSELESSDKEQLKSMDDYIVRELYTEDFKEYTEEVEVNEALLKEYNIRSISENSYF